MRSAVPCLCAATILAAFAPVLQAQQRVTLTAADGVKIFGFYYPGKTRSAPIILLFHQAGANHWEYVPIAPRLVADGFSCLAIDQRAGGDMFGHENETAAHIGHETPNVDALPDLEAALDWARAQNPRRKIIVWGSSYSASLVFVLAAKHPGEIAGLLAFSPGEYFDDKNMIHDAAAKVEIPVYVTSAKNEEEISAARSILAAVPAGHDKVQFVPRIGGVHGSSTLRTDRNPKGAAENWRAVLAFLKQFKR